MAINRTNVGRQMVGDLGNFVGRDLGKQFMSKPQKLAEGDSVAEEIAFETVSFTDDITGKTKTFQYNPETHHPPDSSGRMRKKGVSTSDVATTGGVSFFDTAELVKQPAAPAGPPPIPQPKPLDPINQETGADEAERLAWQSQQSKPITERTAYEVGQTLPDAKLRYKQATYMNPIIKGLTKGFVDVPPRDVLENYMGRGRTGYVQNLSGLNPDPNTAAPTQIEDTRRLGLGIPEDIVKQNIDYAYKTMAKKDKEGDVKKHLSPKEIDHLIAAGEMDFADLEAGPGVKELDRRDEERKGLASLPEKPSIVKGPEPIDPHEDVGGLTTAGEKLVRDSVAEKLITAKPKPAAKPTSFPNTSSDGYFDKDGKWHPEELTQDQKDIRSGKTTLASIRKELDELHALDPAERGLKKGLTSIDAGAGDVRPPESDWSRGFDGLTFGSEEAYLDTIQSEIMGRLDEEDRQRTFERAQVAVNQGDPVLAGQIIAAGSEDQPDAPSDWDETVDYGSPFRQGGLVQLAKGGVDDEDTMIKKGRDNIIDRIMKADKHIDEEHRQQLESWSTEKLWKYLQRHLKNKATEDAGKRAAKRAQEQSERNLVEGDIYPGEKGAGVTRRSLETPYALPDDWKEPGKPIEYQIASGGPVRYANGGGLSSMQPPIDSGDFVIASDVVSGIGDGSSDFGVQRLTEELGVQPRPFSAALGGEVRGPGSGLDDLIQTSVRGKQAARLANQEFVVPRQDVMKIGKGSLKNGQEMLYALMDRVRKQKTGGQQPPRLQGSLAALMGNMRS